ncbi:hypothetical protein [Mucilaginibacter myungsuensis]|uniref:YD repeat-containing protein n=2 Tax=Mucilaginibacter myungsuensis TaxID=649104 RepID=A0A929PWE8_9SPHI|nr:hypothetical protein [Mucilaginibacter myungsuensis]MBE9662001.1 hypothetical protein [Mucilaginibacter myungsuensis]
MLLLILLQLSCKKDKTEPAQEYTDLPIIKVEVNDIDYDGKPRLGMRTNYGYNDARQLIRRVNGGYTTVMKYESGRLTTIDYAANGGRCDYVYDAAGKMTAADIYDQRGTLITAWQVTYDSKGKIATAETKTTTGQPELRVYTYNAEGILAQIVVSDPVTKTLRSTTTLSEPSEKCFVNPWIASDVLGISSYPFDSLVWQGADRLPTRVKVVMHNYATEHRILAYTIRGQQIANVNRAWSTSLMPLSNQVSELIFFY